MELGICFFFRPFFATAGLMSFFPAAKRLQYSSDFRLNEGPKNVFEFIRVSCGTHVAETVFDTLINIKRIAPRVDDISGWIRAQVEQIARSVVTIVAVGFPDHVIGSTR